MPRSSSRSSGRSSGRSGQPAALRQMLEHRPYLLAYLVLFTRDFTRAEELYRDVCVIVCERCAEQPAASDFAAWAREIARERALVALKAGPVAPPPEVLMREIEHVFRGWRQPQPESTSAATPQAEGQVAAVAPVYSTFESRWAKRKEALRAQLRQLPLPGRQLLDLRYARNLPVTKIAERLGLDVHGVAAALNRLRRELEATP